MRPSRRRLAAAVTAVLAVTAGLICATGPARAASVAPDSTTTLQVASEPVVPFPADQELVGVTAPGDLVARDKAGVLWLYLGKGDGTFAPRTRIGGGWNAYRYTVGIGDADRDGRRDLYAYGADETYYYPGTGNWRAPFGARKADTVLDTYPDHTAVSCPAAISRPGGGAPRAGFSPPAL
ncbi:FG-GAP repeat domain-containing protein [Streptomyces sp. NPDC096094]|uniref:FG-GAP repeat domain-containing protein n=1 Tax=Streptomyces sp. NPDC096094 TaxID=3366073 RepID=UPI0037F47FD8